MFSVNFQDMTVFGVWTHLWKLLYPSTIPTWLLVSVSQAPLTVVSDAFRFIHGQFIRQWALIPLTQNQDPQIERESFLHFLSLPCLSCSASLCLSASTAAVTVKMNEIWRQSQNSNNIYTVRNNFIGLKLRHMILTSVAQVLNSVDSFFSLGQF